MNFKTKFINVISEEYQEYLNCKYNLNEKYKEIESRYQKEVAEKKKTELKEYNEQCKERYLKKINKAYDEEVGEYKKEYDNRLSGNSITEDIKLLDDRVKLNENEIKHLFERYKGNNNTLMMRVISEYGRGKGVNIEYDNRDILSDKIKAIDDVYSYAKGYLNAEDNGESFKAIQEKVFPKFDNVISE
ncbi:hypothetical protein KDH02_004808 [Salmonella enterica]|nr:hypothetical protein [Salmonella enterica]EHL2886998.1 hypothetical protein [Salmonella enterica]